MGSWWQCANCGLKIDIGIDHCPSCSGEISAEAKDIVSDIRSDKPDYHQMGADLGRLVAEKQAAYGNSFGNSHRVLEVLYPNGVQPDQYRDMLAMVRIIDKLFRIANDKGYAGESPFSDIAGYGLLGSANS